VKCGLAKLRMVPCIHSTEILVQREVTLSHTGRLAHVRVARSAESSEAESRAAIPHAVAPAWAAAVDSMVVAAEADLMVAAAGTNPGRFTFPDGNSISKLKGESKLRGETWSE